jgi:Uma2 family endonuclease
MSTVVSATQYTPEDLLTMPDGNHYELVDGQLVEHTMSTWASYVAGELHARLRDFSRANRRGWVLPEGTTYQCFPDHPSRVRKADTSFIKLDRMSVEQARAEGHRRIAPDLAAEVVSPNDLAYDVDRKVQEFLTAGVQLVWVVNPEARMVRIHRAQSTGTILREQDELDGEDVLPGFRCPVRELFLPPDGDTSTSSGNGQVSS